MVEREGAEPEKEVCTLKKFLKYCQEVVSKEKDSVDDQMENVVLYGQDFVAKGLKQSAADEWFFVHESIGSQSLPSSWEHDQRQLYYDLAEFQQRQKLVGGELVCGIGIARQVIVDDQGNKRRVWHPVILIPLEIEEFKGQIRLLPAQRPELWSMSPLCSKDDDQHKVRDLEHKFQDFLCEREQRQQQINPFDAATYMDFLHEFRRCWRGVLISTDDARIRPASYENDDIKAYWQALEHKELQLVNEWVLYTRAGDLSLRQKDIQGFIRQLDAAKPPPWASFLMRKLSEPKAEPPCQEAGADASREWLFPLESNPQQKEIADLLSSSHTVVVQGPPGTGKTHTLANVVSDAVAGGRCVLVVSGGQHALQVLLDKLPKCIRNVAMFFGDGQTQDQSQVIQAIDQVLCIIEESRRPEKKAQVAEHEERLNKLLKKRMGKKKWIEEELRRRAELLLLPLTKPLGAWRQSQLAKACQLRETLRERLCVGPLQDEHLLALTLAMCCPRQPGEEEPEWLGDLSADTRAELTAVLTDEVVPILSAVFKRDLYRDCAATQEELLEITQELIALRMNNHLVKRNDQPESSFFVVARGLLEKLRAGQGKGRGHKDRHWKKAREILAHDKELVRAFPLWIMTTGMVSDLLPASFGLFDLVAIDEASKSEVCELPTLLRGDQVLVIGDNKQVSPNDLAFHNRRLNELDWRRETITAHPVTADFFAPDRSVFDVFYSLHSKTVRMLREHFRCTQAIIRFCNEAYYGGKLRPLRVSGRGERLVPPIWVNAWAKEAVPGGAADEEAKAAEQERLDALKARLQGLFVEELKDECRVHAAAAAAAAACLLADLSAAAAYGWCRLIHVRTCAGSEACPDRVAGSACDP